MSATNHTTNYNLPQFVGSDKPAWLGDVNPALNAIDTAMHTNAVKAQQGVDDAQTAQATAETAQTTAETANTNAGTAQTTANSAISAISTTNANLSSFIDKFNLSYRSTANIAGTNVTSNLTLAQDESGSIFKCYGNVILGVNGRINTSLVQGGIFDGLQNYGVATGLYLNSAPSEAYKIFGGVIISSQNPSTNTPQQITRFADICIGTDGQIYLWTWDNQDPRTTNASTQIMLLLPPCLYFNTDFGDTNSGE